MASSYSETAEANELVKCPYNEAHRLLRKRLIPHLVRCRRSHPDVEVVRCPFNSTHQIPEPELNHHISICVDKASIDQYRYNVSQTVKKESADVSKQAAVQCNDDWDDVNTGTYNPQEYIKKAPIIKSKASDRFEDGSTSKRRRHLDDPEEASD